MVMAASISWSGNGLRGGSIYYFRPEAGASTTDLPNGTVAGVWSSSAIGRSARTSWKTSTRIP